MIGGVLLICAFVALSIAVARSASDEAAAALPTFDADARRSALTNASSAARDKAFARVSWGAAADATNVSLGSPSAVPIPVTDGRAVAWVGLPSGNGEKPSFLSLVVSVFAGEKHLFSNTLATQDAGGPPDAVTISFNADAVRAEGVGTEPLTVRLSATAPIGRHADRQRDSRETSLGEARVTIIQP